jgi:hypothetical protein
MCEGQPKHTSINSYKNLTVTLALFVHRTFLPPTWLHNGGNQDISIFYQLAYWFNWINEIQTPFAKRFNRKSCDKFH